MNPIDVIQASNNLVASAGVVGAIAITMVIAMLAAIYLAGRKLATISERFVSGTLAFQDRLVNQMNEMSISHSRAMDEITKTHMNLHSHQQIMSARLDGLCKAPMYAKK